MVDGLSTDGTPEVLARYPHLRVIREPDSGLYDALNKGIRGGNAAKSSGISTATMSTAPGTFAAVAEALADPTVEVVSGGAEILDAARAAAAALREAAGDRAHLRKCHRSARRCPNARFFPGACTTPSGWYDARYRVAADREFLFRVALAAPRAVGDRAKSFTSTARMPDSLTFGSNPAAGGALARGVSRDRGETSCACAGSAAGGAPLHCAAGICARARRRPRARCSAAGSARAAAERAARGCAANFSWPAMFLRHLRRRRAGAMSVSILLPFYNPRAHAAALRGKRARADPSPTGN